MEKERLTAVDAAYLRMETARTPMHTARLLVFRLPDGASEDWVPALVDGMRRSPALGGPYSRRLARSGRWRMSYHWVQADTVDLDHHVRYWSLPGAGNERDLDALLWEIYPKGLDLNRPLWECHVIGNMEGRRFGLLLKIHHAAQDGFGATTFLRRWLSEDPTDQGATGPWALPPARGEDASGPATHAQRTWVSSGAEDAETISGDEKSRVRAECRAYRRRTALERAQSPAGGLLGAMAAPRTLLNARLSPHRSFARCGVELGRLKALSKQTGATVNDVALTIIGGALRHYLEDHQALPERPLVASVPVGIPRRDNRVGNVGTALFCTLGTEIADPLARLRSISAGTGRAKHIMADLSAAAIQKITAEGTSRLFRGQLLGLTRFRAPFFNVAVSNGIYGHEPLYLRGARLETSFPCSVVFDGYALNVTIVGYAGWCSIGYTGCPAAMPDMDRLSALTEQALAEFEAVLATGEVPVKIRSIAGQR